VQAPSIRNTKKGLYFFNMHAYGCTARQYNKDKNSVQSVTHFAISRLNHPTPQSSVRCTLIISFALRLVNRWAPR
jgi:hypothetical protein